MKGLSIPPFLGGKFGSFTRDMTAASGNVSYTGLGFRPRGLIIQGGVDQSTLVLFMGMTDFAGKSSIQCQSGALATLRILNSYIVYLGDAAGSQYVDTPTADADGFTFNWMKSGTPGANTATFTYRAF